MKKLIAILLAVFVLSTAAQQPDTDAASGPVTAPEALMPTPMETAYATTTARERAVWAAPMWTLTETACATATAQAGAAEPTAGGPHSNSFQR